MHSRGSWTVRLNSVGLSGTAQRRGSKQPAPLPDEVWAHVLCETLKHRRHTDRPKPQVGFLRRLNSTAASLLKTQRNLIRHPHSAAQVLVQQAAARHLNGCYSSAVVTAIPPHRSSLTMGITAVHPNMYQTHCVAFGSRRACE